MQPKTNNQESIHNTHIIINTNTNISNSSDESFEYQKDKKTHKKYTKSYKYHQKTGNRCYCLDLLEQFGPINIISKTECSKLYISKLKLIQFEDHFDELFEKGRIPHESEHKDNNKLSIPDITFWYQRYYYYSKYDEGIMMDNESK